MHFVEAVSLLMATCYFFGAKVTDSARRTLVVSYSHDPTSRNQRILVERKR